jgi:5'-nucleotidase
LKLILTNDDGIDAPGIRALELALKNIGRHIVVAPAKSNSGFGHRVTTQSPIRVDAEGKNRYRIDGTPADCSRIALTDIAPDADWVFAGINRGGNLGADVYMSGTVAAVREAALLGYPAIAVSHYVAKNREVDWDLAVRRASPVLHQLMSNPLPSGCFWNVNLPHPNNNDTKLHVVFCRLDTNPHGVQFRKEGSFRVYTGDYHSRPRQAGRDVDVCQGGKISISRIPLDITGPTFSEF